MKTTQSDGDLGRFFSSVRVADVLTFHSHSIKLKENGVGRCRCPFCKSDDQSAFFFNSEFYKCFLCGSTGGVVDLEMYLGCYNTPKQAATALARRYDIDADLSLMPERRGLQHVSQIVVRLLPTDRLCRQALNVQIGRVKAALGVKLSALRDLQRRWAESDVPMSDDERAIQTGLMRDVAALHTAMATLNLEANTLCSNLRRQKSGGAIND